MNLRNSIASAMARLSFASRRSTDAGAPAAATSGLYTNQAVGHFLDALWGLPDPDEVLRRAGKTRADLRALEGDDEISAALETRLSTVLAAPWRLDPWDEVAQFVDAELRPLWEAAVTGAWTAVPYGYSVLEAVYVERPDGRTGLAELAEKPFEWFSPRTGGRLTYRAPNGPVEVDTAVKFFLTARRATYRNPMGEALLSRAFWPWFLRSAGWKAWARFLERAAGPLLLGKTDGDRAKMASALANAVMVGAVAVSAQDSVESVSPPNVGAAFDLFQTAVDKRIQKLILGQTLTTDIKGGGSYAAAKVQDTVRADRTASDLRLVRGTLQRVVHALVALNFPSATAPQLIVGDEKTLAPERAQRDATLVNAGIVRFTKKYLLDRYDFEEGDIEEATPAPPSAAGGLRAHSRAEQLRFAARGGLTDAQDGQSQLDALADAAIDAAPAPVDPAALSAAIRDASGPEDLAERLGALAGDLHRSEFRGLLERALFAADVLGYASADRRSSGT